MRLVRHLSFSNVIAVLALFIALGGAAYAGSKIDGNSIKNKSIGGGKLKNETITANKIKKGTITSAQIAPGSIDSTQINVNTLTMVPSAQMATTATTATTAKSAETATRATSAVTAEEAGEAMEADAAKHAKEADRATLAGEAEKLGGKTAAELILSCRTGTEPYGGVCWDETTRPINFWLVAVKVCGNAGGRLPLIGELIAYLTHDGNATGPAIWSGSLVGVGGSEKVLTSDDEEHLGESGPAELGYRCVYPLGN